MTPINTKINRIKALLDELEPIQRGQSGRAVFELALHRIQDELTRLKDYLEEDLAAVPRCSHGFTEPHSMGGKTGFHYDVAGVCEEWISKGGIIVFPYRLKEKV